VVLQHTRHSQTKQSLKQGKGSILLLFRPHSVSLMYSTGQLLREECTSYFLAEKEMILYLPIVRDFLNSFPDPASLSDL